MERSPMPTLNVSPRFLLVNEYPLRDGRDGICGSRKVVFGSAFTLAWADVLLGRKLDIVGEPDEDAYYVAERDSRGFLRPATRPAPSFVASILEDDGIPF